MRNYFCNHLLISDQVTADDICLVCNQLKKVLDANVPGDIVEFGCYIGTTSLFIRRLLDKQNQQDREFHAYDSFEGLPKKTYQDQSAAGENFKAGELAVSKKELLRQFQKANLQPPIVHKAWFNQLSEADIPKQIAFGFLDGDFYDSVMDSLKLVWPRLSVGAKILIDDYQRPELPGPEIAVHDFFKTRGLSPRILVKNNIAVIDNFK